jgi:hypothetical protein
MRKMTLKVEDLEITSFETARAESERGTVEAQITPSGNNSCYPPVTCDGDTCLGPTCRSCAVSCDFYPCSYPCVTAFPCGVD